MGRKLSVLAVTSVLALSLVGSSGKILADANENASCLGLGSSSAGPAKFRDEVAHNVQAFAEVTGTTPGAVISELAQRHPGSIGPNCAVPSVP